MDEKLVTFRYTANNWIKVTDIYKDTSIEGHFEKY